MGVLFFMLSLFAGGAGALAQADSQASPEAKALYRRLYSLSRNFEDGKIIYGHQNAFHEGRGWSMGSNSDWNGELPESDLHKVIGKDPGLVGYDFVEIGPWNEELIAGQMRLLHQKGAVLTLSWHLQNFFPDGSETNAWDTRGETVRLVTSDPEFARRFYSRLDRLVAFLNKVKDVPMIFRPWHEHNYSWFWWGKDHCTSEEYLLLWRMTADYLKGKGIHQLLYAYSPDTIQDDYFDRYPGDDYVDVLGVDTYFNSLAESVAFMGPSPLDAWKKGVLALLAAADQRGKIPAITEFGNEGLTYDRFWTDYFSAPLERDAMRLFASLHGLPEPSLKPAYTMVWRNDRSLPQHFFSPFPGAPGNQNFMELVSKNVFSFLGDEAPTKTRFKRRSGF